MFSIQLLNCDRRFQRILWKYHTHTGLWMRWHSSKAKLIWSAFHCEIEQIAWMSLSHKYLLCSVPCVYFQFFFFIVSPLCTVSLLFSVFCLVSISSSLAMTGAFRRLTIDFMFLFFIHWSTKCCRWTDKTAYQMFTLEMVACCSFQCCVHFTKLLSVKEKSETVCSKLMQAETFPQKLFNFVCDRKSSYDSKQKLVQVGISGKFSEKAFSTSTNYKSAAILLKILWANKTILFGAPIQVNLFTIFEGTVREILFYLFSKIFNVTYKYQRMYMLLVSYNKTFL